MCAQHRLQWVLFVLLPRLTVLLPLRYSDAVRPPLPDTFNAVRRMEFRKADFNADGLLSKSPQYYYGKNLSEWNTIFKNCFEFRLSWPSGLDALQSFPSKHHKRVRGRLHKGLMKYDDFLTISIAALWNIVDQTSGVRQRLKSRGLAFLSLHLWAEAEVAFSDGLKFHVVPMEILQELSADLFGQSHHAEHAWLWDFMLRNGFTTFETNLENSPSTFVLKMKHSKRLRKLVPPPSEYANAEYLQSIRGSVNATCEKVKASKNAVARAIQNSRPVVLRGARLVPDIQEWAAALREQHMVPVMLSASPEGVFYQTKKFPRDETVWGVRPARVPITLRDMEAAAATKGVRFYLSQSSIIGLPGFEALVPGIPQVADGLNLSRKNLWATLGGGAVSLLHFDAMENILAQVHGTKEVFLWPPSDYARLGYAPRPQVHMSFECCPARFHEQRHDTHLTWNQAEVDIRYPEKYPSLLGTSPTYCQLFPGDALVIPEYWTHLTISYPGNKYSCDMCVGLSNLAINFWFLSHRPAYVSELDLCATLARQGDCSRYPRIAEGTCKDVCAWHSSATTRDNRRQDSVRTDL